MERGCSRDLQEKFRKGGIRMSTTATLESPLFIAFSILYREPGLPREDALFAMAVE